MEIRKKISDILKEIGNNVTLVAVSKTKPDTLIKDAYDFGQRDFGENKVQDLKAKAERLPKDIRWHMIGRIQTNKIKDFIGFVHLIHGVDRTKALRIIDKEARKAGRIVDILIQVHISQEETKAGFSIPELMDLVKNNNLNNYENVRVRGLMGMASFTDNKNQITHEFSILKELFDQLKRKINSSHFDILSTGMSGDFKIAIKEGSNMIRLGTALFGERNY
ncbi:MAG: YggS family pyridoxal phosphate-dependent enzyme [Schleiferiaceae bacterium]|nr:YggS family pyridoxal phosphate-dependent enzyme [Schleiferiaceae bacterium]